MLTAHTREKLSLALGGSGKAYDELLSLLDLLDSNGNTYFVSSITGNDNNNGTTWGQAKATLDSAVGLCGANQGDRILVAAGHSETLSSAGALDLDVAGITVIGLGQGGQRPTFTLDTADTADIDVDAANITVRNCIFKSGFADIAVCFDVNADDFTLMDCSFVESADNENFLVCVQDAAAGGSDRISIVNCTAIQDDASNTHFVNFAGTGTGHRVVGNVLIGDWGTIAVGGAGVITFCTIKDNVIYNAATTVDSCINLAATATGVVVNNMCAGAAAQANGVTATACLIAENYYGVLAEDLSAILDPIAT
jgi:hypothetical protein